MYLILPYSRWDVACVNWKFHLTKCIIHDSGRYYIYLWRLLIQKAPRFFESTESHILEFIYPSSISIRCTAFRQESRFHTIFGDKVKSNKTLTLSLNLSFYDLRILLTTSPLKTCYYSLHMYVICIDTWSATRRGYK